MYLQGGNDLATPAIGATTHYQNVPAHFAQLILVPNVGHVPGLPIYEYLKATYSPEAACFRSTYHNILNGNALSEADLKTCGALGPFEFDLTQKVAP